jgi:Protein of unknown function (DUF3043)
VRPLVPADRKEAERASKAQVKEDRRKQREAMYAGEEWALMPRDRGPERAFIRDHIDARWNLGEYLLPAMLIGLPLSLIPDQRLLVGGMTLIYGIFLLSVIDFILMWMRLRKKLVAKFGAVPKGGTTIMAVSRYVQIRPTRVPRPRVKRGQYPS